MSDVTLAEKEFEALNYWGGVKARFSDSTLSTFSFICDSVEFGKDASSTDVQSERDVANDNQDAELTIADQGPVEYMEQVLLPQLKPKMFSTLQEALEKDIFDNGRSFFFNATNCLTQAIMNIDPLRPENIFSELLNTSLGQMCQPPIKERTGRGVKYSYALDQMSKDTAARIIQRQVRGWLIRKELEVQEMRQFWKAIKSEKRVKSSAASASSHESLKSKRKKCKGKY